MKYRMTVNEFSSSKFWSPEKVAVLKGHLESLPPDKLDFPAEVVKLITEWGAEASVQKLDSYKYSLHLTFSLGTSIEDQRKWVQVANRFFGPKLIKESESRHPSESFKLTKGRFNIDRGEQWDPDDPNAVKTPFEMRYRTFAGRESEKFGGTGKKKRRGPLPIKAQRRAKALWHEFHSITDQKEKLDLVEKVYNQEGWPPLYGNSLLDVIRRSRPRIRSRR
jgi:hypothetical protein